MKPQDLKFPSKKHPHIEDRVWYPDSFFKKIERETPPLSFDWYQEDVFACKQPICIEYCSGNGAWIALKAQLEPHYNWVALERKFERVRKIWSKRSNHSLDNLFIVCGEAYATTHAYFPSATVQHVYVNFPDPWPKNRHAKHRLIQSLFVEEILRILQPNGTLTLVTDDIDYSEQMIATLALFPQLQPVFSPKMYVEEYPGYGSSYFEELWRQKGKIIRYHVFQKIEN